MGDDSTKKPLDVSEISKQLSEGKLSRRGLLDRLRTVGIGFGAAFLLGVGGRTAKATGTVALKSTNPAVDNIIQEGQRMPTGNADDGSERQQLASDASDDDDDDDDEPRDDSPGYDRQYDRHKYDRHQYDRHKYDRQYERYSRYERYSPYERYSRSYDRSGGY